MSESKLSKRIEFLNDFLRALGAVEVVYTNESFELVKGTVIYDLKDVEERQDFCWRISESDVPSKSVYDLVKLLNEYQLLDIDRIILNRSKLVSRFNARFGKSISQDKLVEILTELGGVYVDMVDDGESTDKFFIHE